MVDVLERPAELEGHGHDEHHGPTGVMKWLTSTDHKVIGLSYTITSVIMLVIGGAFAEIIRAQLATPNNTLVSLAQFNELFTMHGSLDDLPLRRALRLRRPGQLHRADPDRRARHGLPAAQRPVATGST